MNITIIISDKYQLAALTTVAQGQDPKAYLEQRINDLIASYTKQCGYDVAEVSAKVLEATAAQAKVDAVK